MFEFVVPYEKSFIQLIVVLGPQRVQRGVQLHDQRPWRSNTYRLEPRNRVFQLYKEHAEEYIQQHRDHEEGIQVQQGIRSDCNSTCICVFILIPRRNLGSVRLIPTYHWQIHWCTPASPRNSLLRDTIAASLLMDRQEAERRTQWWEERPA